MLFRRLGDNDFFNLKIKLFELETINSDKQLTDSRNCPSCRRENMLTACFYF